MKNCDEFLFYICLFFLLTFVGFTIYSIHRLHKSCKGDFKNLDKGLSVNYIGGFMYLDEEQALKKIITKLEECIYDKRQN